MKFKPNVVFLLFCLFFIDFRELQLAVLPFSKLEKELNYRYIVSQCCVVGFCLCLFVCLLVWDESHLSLKYGNRRRSKVQKCTEQNLKITLDRCTDVTC